jgi:hypothetical protein
LAGDSTITNVLLVAAIPKTSALSLRSSLFDSKTSFRFQAAKTAVKILDAYRLSGVPHRTSRKNHPQVLHPTTDCRSISTTGLYFFLFSIPFSSARQTDCGWETHRNSLQPFHQLFVGANTIARSDAPGKK